MERHLDKEQAWSHLKPKHKQHIKYMVKAFGKPAAFRVQLKTGEEYIWRGE